MKHEYIQKIVNDLESEQENSVLIGWVEEILTEMHRIATEEANAKHEEAVNELKAELKKWKGNSFTAFINGMCPSCGNEPLQGIVSDREGYSKLHCFNCSLNKYEWQGELNNKENNNG
ncbi:hypothetical protein QWI44_02825 [Acinetobacter pittii]|uniref:hypothetical protein n=1 Tax=Acinetobacter pittii TaxID=48296 RepID=UPI0027423F23|nr:hypothetical protein [Acinetobacter pittii]MDP7899630.1 hypothetical protein [Acinetobacter pittii]